ncbi:hypothetical protein J437_LFUL019471 [Ladona fulva]|uniref:Uncharacterized protein n=1 Tax=Ladona fulva TaxID=123851 RepID=A0A8K0PAL7_LADFU|nr:hypothetical protein J437_LFUL019471 [Ladona fulva]
MELEKFDVKISSDKAYISMTGLFDGDKTLNDLDVHWIIEGKPKTDSKGKTYLELEKFDVKISSDKAYLSMTGLFDGDKTLSETMLKFLNEHQKEFIKEIEPALNEAFSQLYLGLAKPMFRKLPYNEMFPDL